MYIYFNELLLILPARSISIREPGRNLTPEKVIVECFVYVLTLAKEAFGSWHYIEPAVPAT